MTDWVRCEDRLPDVKPNSEAGFLCTVEAMPGRPYVTVLSFFKDYEDVCCESEDFEEPQCSIKYDEDRDVYLTNGWFSYCEWSEPLYWAVHDKVIAWAPLPEPLT